VKWHTPLTWPFKLLLWLLTVWAAAEALADADDGDAERGRRTSLGRHHPTSHLPPHNR
jgi:hypothetical protein